MGFLCLVNDYSTYDVAVLKRVLLGGPVSRGRVGYLLKRGAIVSILTLLFWVMRRWMLGL